MGFINEELRTAGSLPGRPLTEALTGNSPAPREGKA